MKVDLAAPITDLKGVTLKEGEDDMTLGSVICTVMLNIHQEDQTATGTKKMQMFRLAQQAVAGGEAELKAEDVVLLKDRVAKMCGALIVGRVYDLLEPPKE